MKLRLGLTHLGAEEGTAEDAGPPAPPQTVYLTTDRNETLATEAGDQLVVDTDDGQ
jgi:hypothetical protein